MNRLEGFEMTDMWDRGVRKVVSMDGDGQWICSDEKDDEINRLMGIKKNDYMHGGMRGEYGNECEKVGNGYDGIDSHSYYQGPDHFSS